MRVITYGFVMKVRTSIKTDNPHFFQARCQIKSELIQQGNQLRAQKTRAGRQKAAPVILVVRHMKPKYHLRMVQAIGIFSGLSSAGIVIGLGILFRDFVLQAEWMFAALFFGSFIISQILFHTFIAPKLPADCPQCRGRSYLSGHKIYTCSVCGHKTDLNLWGREGEIGKKIFDVADKAESKTKGK